MNKRFALILACCAAASVVACNETVDWKYTESCEDDAKQCRDSKVMMCVGGVWEEIEECKGEKPVCDAATHECVAKTSPVICTNGSKKCQDNTVYACTNGNWIAETQCTADQTCNSETYKCDNNAAPAECVAADTKCDANNNLITCGSDGTWGTGVACTGDTPVCGTKESKAACVEQTAATCEDNNGNAQAVGYAYCSENGKRIVCGDDGKWDEDTSCNGKLCEEGADDASATCRDYESCASDNEEYAHNATICDGNAVKICNDGNWENDDDCATLNKVCDAANNAASCREYRTCAIGDGTSATTVNHGADACDGAVLKTCNDSNLTIKENCAENDPAQICDAATKTCRASQSSDCTVDGKTVPTGAAVCSGTEIVTCTNGTRSEEPCSTTVANATATCADVNSVATCGFECIDGYELSNGACIEKTKYTTINQIRSAYDDFVDAACSTSDGKDTVKPAEVEITGVVTGVRNDGMGFYIQDATDGIQVFCGSSNCAKYSDNAEVNVGDSVKVVADGIGQFWCEMQVRKNSANVTFEKLATALEEIEPEIAEISDLAGDSNNSKNTYLGKLITIAAATADNWDTNSYWNVKQNTQSITVRGYLMATDVVRTAMTANKTYDVTGVAIWNWNAVRVAPRSLADIVEKCIESKCEGGKYYECLTGGTYAEGTTVPADVSNGSWSCQNNGWILTCSQGFVLNGDKNTCNPDPNYCTTGVCSETEYKPCNTETHAYGTVESKPAAVENGSWNCDAANGWSLTCNPDSQINATGDACDTIETPCTSNKCEDNKYYTCTEGSYDAGTPAPGSVTGGKWNCEVATGWTLTCTDPYENDTENTCKLMEGKCVANSDCDGGKLCDTTNNVCEVCTAECLDDDTPGGKSIVTTCDGEKKVFDSEFSCKSETEIGVCKNNDSRCAIGASASLEKCVAGEWQADEDCSELGVTHAETYECSDATCSVKTCETGFTVGTDKLSCVPESTSECTETETKCEDTKASAVVSTCNSGKWTAGTADSTVSCAGNVLGVCKNGATQCAAGTTVGIETCANGAWDEAVACSGIAGAATYSCDTTAVACKVETCTDTNKEPNADKTACIDKTTPAPTTSLIISEYVHGSSNKRAIEIYNTGEASVDLSACKFKFYMRSNKGAFSESKESLAGTLNAGKTFVACSSELKDSVACDKNDLNAAFNGDDTIVLICNDTTIDSIGKKNDTNKWGEKTTLVRKCDITAGDTNFEDDFDATVEWNKFAEDTFSNLGNHTAVCPAAE